jgi:SlyX protein
MKEQQQRIENLEMLAMEQDNTIETLNREVHRQQQQIQALEIQLKYLKEKIDAIGQEEPLSPDIEDEAPPPHY